VGDRVGFHHVMLVVGVWPVLLHLATDLWAGLRPVNRDIEDRLYSRFAYICTKVQAYTPESVIEKMVIEKKGRGGQFSSLSRYVVLYKGKGGK